MAERILIFIPAYNCEKQLPRVIAKIDARLQALAQEVLIIDNQSGDATLRVAAEAAAGLAINVTLLRNRRNYSLGGSIKRAFLYALAHDYDYIVTLHGDDQADIRDLLPVLESGRHRENDLVIGARFHPLSRLTGYSRFRRVGNSLLNGACSLVCRRKVHDLIAGLNIFRVGFLRDKFFLRFPDDLTFDAHLLLYAFDDKAKVLYSPISWREEDQVSNARVFRQAWTILLLFADYLLNGEKVFCAEKGGEVADESDVMWAK